MYVYVVIPAKQEIYGKFEQASDTNEDETLSFLEDLRGKYDDLYNYGCLLEKAHKYASIMFYTGKHNYICGYFNDWVNEKNEKHTSNGKNCEHVELWEQYIEKLWIQLLQKATTPNWCTRTKVTYTCAKSSPYVTGISVSFFLLAMFGTVFLVLSNFKTLKRRFHKFLNKNERIRNNIYKYVPQKLLGYSENMDTQKIDETINLSYYSSHNS
ncbi:PIR Superfamily Protein [Plasmodium ovale wallikeri]|uniref:PIR Superfamily Protein n=1 Tax=Plasmodium ovale wallikeri TaxID=864142 RepID=A0A1A9AJC3_PLAOA|nr:PIR Superfamily Protein [Plasmodium ovale wallikeri]SBT59282.1 PIR Superfamily Protein [Plasmodium ovale wallikeri]